MSLRSAPEWRVLPDYNKVINMSEDELLAGFKPSDFTKDVNLWLKYEQDAEANRFLKFLKEKDSWEFTQEEFDSLDFYWLKYELKSRMNDSSKWVHDESDVDENKETNKWFEKNDNWVYSCTANFVWALLMTYSGPYYKDSSRQWYKNRKHNDEILESSKQPSVEDKINDQVNDNNRQIDETLNLSTTINGYTFPEKLFKLYPNFSKSILEANQATWDYDKLNIINKIYKSLELIRYAEDHIYDMDDTALLPEWSWIREPFKKVEEMSKDLNWKLYWDLAE